MDEVSERFRDRTNPGGGVVPAIDFLLEILQGSPPVDSGDGALGNTGELPGLPEALLGRGCGGGSAADEGGDWVPGWEDNGGSGFLGEREGGSGGERNGGHCFGARRVSRESGKWRRRENCCG